MLVPMRRSLTILGFGLAVTLVPWLPAGIAATPAAAAPVAASPQVISQKPCPDSIFTCIRLRVPRDYFAAPGGPTFDVTFGLLRASKSPRKGVFVTITGGPGTASLASADSYIEFFDPKVTERYDIAFLGGRKLTYLRDVHGHRSATGTLPG